jgi:hypothetical protein
MERLSKVLDEILEDLMIQGYENSDHDISYAEYKRIFGGYIIHEVDIDDQ